MFTACYLTTSLVVLSVGARYLMSNRFIEEAKTMVRMGLGMVAVLAPLQMVIGDAHGLNTAQYQPAKVAAMEAHWDGSKPADLILFAWPDQKAEKNHFEIAIPKLASFIITHDLNGLFKGLKDFKPEDRPPVAPVFFAFRVMVGIGIAMIAIGVDRRVFVDAENGFRNRLVSAAADLCVAARIHRHSGRMVGDGNRPPAVSSSTAFCGPSTRCRPSRSARC